MDENAMIQNLKDAGCDAGTIQEFLDDLHEGKQALGLKCLATHHRALLHEDQQRIDCLDYLVFQLGRNSKPTKKK